MPNKHFQFGKKRNKRMKSQQKRRLLEKARELQSESEKNLNPQ